MNAKTSCSRPVADRIVTVAAGSRNRRWVICAATTLLAGSAVGLCVLEYFARTTRIETNENGVSVIEPRGFLAAANVAEFLRVGYTQWVRSGQRNECFSVGDGCCLTANDTDKNGTVDQIYILLRDEAILPYLQDRDRELAGLRIFAHADADGRMQVDSESLDELQRVLQRLFDDGMKRHANCLGGGG